MICDNTKDNICYDVKEMMFGFNDYFNYMECGECGCLQLINIPENLSKYYPDNYYSFEQNRASGIKKFLLDLIDKAIAHKYKKSEGVMGKLLCTLFPEILPPIEPSGNVFDKKILDVGCGNGKLLKKLAALGFTNLFGVDLFIEKDMVLNLPNLKEIKILKGTLFDIQESFDIIMFNTSFEHMLEQKEILLRARAILHETGTCIIKIPTTSSYAWKTYRENWFGLDAPRHLFLHSTNSINKLSKKCGLKIEKIIYDSLIDIGLTRSSLYKKGWDVDSQNRFLYSPIGMIYVLKHIIMAKWLNTRNQGDSITIYLKKDVEICKL